MKERGIILTADEVRGLRDGSLRELRRPMKQQPSDYVPGPNRHPTTRTGPYFDAYCSEPKTPQNPRGMSDRWCWWSPDNRQGPDWIRCPFGQPGDRLWVKETYAIVDGEVEYKADYMYPSSTWRSPATMPRWASRWTLEIEAVRVERLQDISEESAKASGVRSVPLQEDERGCWWTKDVAAGPSLHGRSPRDAYAKAWDRAYGQTSSWEMNPWVWVIGVKQVAS